MRTLLLLLLLGTATGCQGQQQRPGPYQEPDGEGSGGGIHSAGAPSTGSECETPAEVDTSAACGNDTVRLFQRKPNVYFVLDISGSMTSRLVRGDDSKIDAAKEALTTVAAEIGHRVQFGLTTFPGDEEPDLNDLDPDDPIPLWGCSPGDEIFPLQAGDPLVCLNKRPNGPVLRDFKRQVEALQPHGGTPLSPTLVNLTPSVIGLEGSTAIVLLTDGSPNCNPRAECEAEQCSLNWVGTALDGTACDEGFNCCDPENVSDLLADAGGYCEDSNASASALERLSRAGVFTYVIGVLGDEDFDDSMNALAEAGGRPRSGDRAYYDVESLDELTDAVRTIGSAVAQNCEIELLDRPPAANELNVYFDGEVVPNDGAQGWTLNGEVVTLHGDACHRVRGGEVTEVQLISGCETVIR